LTSDNSSFNAFTTKSLIDRFSFRAVIAISLCNSGDRRRLNKKRQDAPDGTACLDAICGIPLKILLLYVIERLHAWVFGDAFHGVFDAHQLVVLGDAVGARHGAGFNLAGFAGYGKVGKEGVFGFAGAVGYDGGVAGALGHIDALDGLGNGANLVELDEYGIAGAHRYALFKALGVGDKKVIAHDLDLAAQGFGQLDVAFPVVLVQAILYGADGILGHPFGVDLDHLVSAEQLVGV